MLTMLALVDPRVIGPIAAVAPTREATWIFGGVPIGRGGGIGFSIVNSIGSSGGGVGSEGASVNQSLNRPFDSKSGIVGRLLLFVNACDANSSELDRQRACQRGPDLPFLLLFIVKRFRHRKLDTREVKKLRKPTHRAIAAEPGRNTFR